MSPNSGCSYTVVSIFSSCFYSFFRASILSFVAWRICICIGYGVLLADTIASLFFNSCISVSQSVSVSILCLKTTRVNLFFVTCNRPKLPDHYYYLTNIPSVLRKQSTHAMVPRKSELPRNYAPTL